MCVLQPFPLGDYMVEPGSTVWVPFWALHRSEATWARAAEFLPVRAARTRGLGGGTGGWPGPHFHADSAAPTHNTHTHAARTLMSTSTLLARHTGTLSACTQHNTLVRMHMPACMYSTEPYLACTALGPAQREG